MYLQLRPYQFTFRLQNVDVNEYIHVCLTTTKHLINKYYGCVFLVDAAGDDAVLAVLTCVPVFRGNYGYA